MPIKVIPIRIGLSYQEKMLNDIHYEEEKLLEDMGAGNLTKEEYCKRYNEMSSKTMEIGEVFDSLEDLEKRLGVSPLDYNTIKAIIDHERKHAEIAKRYGVTSKFVYISGWIHETVSTIYFMPEEAENWTYEQEKEFIISTTDVGNPSREDKLGMKIELAALEYFAQGKADCK